MKRCTLAFILAIGLICAARWLTGLMVNAQANRVATRNGDTNGDGARDLSDALYLLNWLFLGGAEPVAIAGSPELESRVETLEAEVARLAGGSPLEQALENLKKLSTGGEKVWDFPTRLLTDTASASGAMGTASLSLGGRTSGRVLGFRLDEGISVESSLDLIEEIPIPSYTSINPGTPVELRYHDGTGDLVFHGEVDAVSIAGADDRNVYVTIRAFDKFHRLTRGRKSRTFQGMKSSDIVSRIMAEAGIAPAEYQILLESAYPTREYVVQYNETDFDFVRRLLAEDGIYFFVIHSSGGARIRFGDGQNGRIPAPAEPLVYAGYNTDAPAPGPAISALHRTSSTVVGRVTVGDYDFLTVNARFGSASRAGVPGEDYHFGVNLFEDVRLNALAQRELELIQDGADTLAGAANATQLRSGSLVSIQGTHERFNGKYLVQGCTHRYVSDGGVSSFGNTFTCISESVRFRPPKLTPRPTIPGVQSAIVTGPSGQRVHTDAYGRVKVHFHWDREGSSDQNSSAWVRVAQNRAGTATQGYFLPEIGDEVLVAFEHGDIDRPVVIGQVWNGTDRPPLN